MKPFMDKDFLLSTDMAKTLYHDYAGGYANCRLPLPHQSAGNL